MRSIFLKGGLLALGLTGFLIPSKAEAKMFGQECETVVTGGGESCVITQTICKQRFFWINVGTSVEYGAPDCSAFIE